MYLTGIHQYMSYLKTIDDQQEAIDEYKETKSAWDTALGTLGFIAGFAAGGVEGGQLGKKTGEAVSSVITQEDIPELGHGSGYHFNIKAGEEAQIYLNEQSTVDLANTVIPQSKEEFDFYEDMYKTGTSDKTLDPTAKMGGEMLEMFGFDDFFSGGMEGTEVVDGWMIS